MVDYHPLFRDESKKGHFFLAVESISMIIIRLFF